AKDKVRAIDSTRSPFDHFALHQAKAEGYFDEENLDVDIIWSDGGAATLQTLITRSRDIAIGAGVMSVIGAFSKGAPLTIVGNVKRGADDLYWYVPVDSPIKSFEDLDGKQLVYSRPGSTTHLVSQFILQAIKAEPKLVSVGGMS